ncbi:MAG TPA: LppX_LprAFG lipoprotein [Gemmatimonadaceae bacterium]|jgi:hypothetical protein|nr:LppX_LprAFG lipoprotein [Gemmatimonadaceae bacterium]
MKVHQMMYGLLLAPLLLPVTIPAHGGHRQIVRAEPMLPYTPPPAAAELLRHAAANFMKTRALQFALVAHQIPAGLHLSGVAGGDGSAIWPDHLVFQGSIQQTPALAMSFVMVMCGPAQYIELGDGVFQQIPGAPNVGRLLFAPDTSFVANVLLHLEQPSTPQAATLEQVATWHLTGTIPNKVLAPLTGVGGPGPVQAELWIGQQDLRLHQVTLRGAMFTGDSAQTTRTLSFSHFDEHLTLTVPRGQLPCGAPKT